MAKIVRANDMMLGNQSRLNINSAVGENIGLITQGQLTSQSAEIELQKKQYYINQGISNKIDAEGKRMFEQSKAAYQASILSDKMNIATENFMKGKIARYRSTTDKNGNYTYRTLPQDIEGLGKNILKDTIKSIPDADVAQQFALRFNSYISNQKISALQEASRQQVTFGLESLDKGLGSIINQASRDNIDQLDTYYSQGAQVLNDALIGGIISKPDYDQKLQQFNIILKDKVLRNVIHNDRATAIKTLNRPATELGITEEDKSKYSKLLDTTLKSDEIALKKAEELQKIDDANEESSIIEDLTARMEADTLREDELLAFDGLISPNRFSQMKTEYVRQARKREAERQKMAGLAARLREGDNLNDVSNNDINNIFNYMLQQRAHMTGGEPTLSEQAQIAALIPRPVKDFASNLETSIKNGNPKNATEMLAAYTYIKDRGKNTLDSGFSKDAVAIMEHAESLVNKGGLSQEEALIKARENLRFSSSELYKDAIAEFSRFDFESGDFTFSKIQDTAASDLDLKPWFGKNSTVPRDIAYEYKDFVREGYAKLGNIDDAKKYAKALMNRRYGKSKTNGKGESQYILRPPEKIWPKTPSEVFRTILLDDMKTLLPENVDTNTINIHSDTITSNVMTLKFDDKGNIVNKEVPTWTVSYIDPVTGDIMSVMNPDTGQIRRWSPVGSTYYDTKKAKLLSETKTENIKRREERSRNQEASFAEQFLEGLADKPGII